MTYLPTKPPSSTTAGPLSVNDGFPVIQGGVTKTTTAAALKALLDSLTSTGSTGSGSTGSTGTPTVSPAGTTVSTVGPTIVDAAKNVYSISSDGYVVTNGVKENGANGTPTTANVVEEYYDGTLFYQKNSSNQWYSRPNPATAYSGPVADPTNTGGLPTMMRGVNMLTLGNGVAGSPYFSAPVASHLDYFSGKGIKFMRALLLWERLQKAINGPLDTTYSNMITATLDAMAARGMYCVLDIHNYMEYSVGVTDGQANSGTRYNVGSTQVPLSALYDLWTKIATKWGTHPALLVYGIMNEPKPTGDGGLPFSNWTTAAQGAVNAIRAVETTKYISCAIYAWSNINAIGSGQNDTLNITDPSGKLLYEIHGGLEPDAADTYLNGNYDYYSNTVTPEGVSGLRMGTALNTSRINRVVTWANARIPKPFGVLWGEIGVPSTDSRYITLLQDFYSKLPANHWVSYYMDGAGAFDDLLSNTSCAPIATNYANLSCEQPGPYTDRLQMPLLVQQAGLTTYGSTGATGSGSTGSTGATGSGSTGSAGSNSSPVVRNTATTPAPVTLLALRIQAAPTAGTPVAGESADGTMLTASDGQTAPSGSITTNDGTKLTLVNSGAGTELYVNGANAHLKEGNNLNYPFPATQLKYHVQPAQPLYTGYRRLAIRSPQNGYDDWYICFGSPFDTCYISGEDPNVTDTYVIPSAPTGQQPYPLGSRVGNADASTYNDWQDQAAAMLGPIQFLNVFNDFNRDWSGWEGAAYDSMHIMKSNPKSASMIPVIGFKMARNGTQYSYSRGGPQPDNYFEFQDVANGVHDAVIRAAADQWHSNYKFCYWRIAYEFNGDFMPDWFGDTSDKSNLQKQQVVVAVWIQAFQKYATIIRQSAAANGATAYIIWNPNVTQYSTQLVTDAWPGDSYVDIIGFDRYSPVYNNVTDQSKLYDWSKNDGSTCADNATWMAIPENRIVYWDYGGVDQYAKGGDGLGNANQFAMQRALAFAKAKNKPIMMCETGSGNTHGDASQPFRGPVDDPVFPLWLRSRLDQAVNMGVPVISVMTWLANEGDGGWGSINGERRRQAQSWSAGFGGTQAATLLTGAIGGSTGSTAGTGSTGSVGVATAKITDTSGNVATITLSSYKTFYGSGNDTSLTCNIYYYLESTTNTPTVGSSADGSVSALVITKNGTATAASGGLAGKTTYA